MKYNPIDINKKTFYTKGKEYMSFDGVEYIGYYYSKNNILFTDNDDKLYKYNNNSNFIDYLNLSGTFIYDKFTDPYNYIPVPNETDYDNTYFERYFIKKRNDIKSSVIEIDKKQFDTLTDNNNKGIDNYLYYGIKFNWVIKGYMYDTIINNIKYSGVYDTNKRTVQLNNLNMYGLNNILTDYLQYYRT